MRTRLVTLVLITGCDYLAPTDPEPKPEPDAPPGCTSFSTLVDTCELAFGGALDLAGSLTFDTNTGALFSGATPVNVDTQTLMTPAGEVKAILASAVVFQSNATLRATGARPFAILANDSITLSPGVRIDVAEGGAGARSDCPNPPARGTDRNGGAGGGGGGGFAAVGGTGGGGDADSGSPAPGGVGGLAVALPDGVLGGCAGAPGGDDNNDVGGAGGVGGGSVALVAGRRIEISTGAGIDAGGQGGRGGAQHMLFDGDAGGGGGGSGGMIVLEAPDVTCSGTLAANGGGGGEGSGATARGNNGEKGNFGIARANGGRNGSSSGSDGGLGGAKLDIAGATVGNVLNGGGGGGGGAAGFIRILAPTQALTDATLSPDPS